MTVRRSWVTELDYEIHKIAVLEPNSGAQSFNIDLNVGGSRLMPSETPRRRECTGPKIGLGKSMVDIVVRPVVRLGWGRPEATGKVFWN